MKGLDRGHTRILGFAAAMLGALGRSTLLGQMPGGHGPLAFERMGKVRRRTHIRRSCLNRYGSSARGNNPKYPDRCARPMVVLDAQGYQVGTMIDGKLKDWRAGPRVKHRFEDHPKFDGGVWNCIHCDHPTELGEGGYCPEGTIPIRDQRRAA